MQNSDTFICWVIINSRNIGHTPNKNSDPKKTINSKFTSSSNALKTRSKNRSITINLLGSNTAICRDACVCSFFLCWKQSTRWYFKEKNSISNKKEAMKKMENLNNVTKVNARFKNCFSSLSYLTIVLG